MAAAARARGNATAAKAKQPKIVIIVSSATDKDEIGINQLAGEYVESGQNHGKRVFMRINGGEGQEVIYIYYWDKRDGPEFSGWWFGEAVGGSEVWSRCESHADLPPHAGWRLPWDGEVSEELVVKRKPQQQSKAAEEAASGKGASLNESSAAAPPVERATTTKPAAAKLQEELKLASDVMQRCTDSVSLAEIEATQVLEGVKVMLDGDVSFDILQTVQELLQEQLASLVEVHKELAAETIKARANAPKQVAGLKALVTRTRSLQAALMTQKGEAEEIFTRKNEEEEEAKATAEAERTRLETEAKAREVLHDILQEMKDGINEAESELQSLQEALDKLTVGLGDGELSSGTAVALQALESSAAKAKLKVNASIKKVQQRQREANGLPSDLRQVALGDFGEMLQRLRKLSVLADGPSNIRLENDRRRQARKWLTETAETVGAIEAEIIPILAEAPSSADFEVEITARLEACEKVYTKVKSTISLIESKLSETTGTAVVQEEIDELTTRATGAEAKLAAHRSKLDARMAEIKKKDLLKHALALTQKVEASALKMAKAEEPLQQIDSSSLSIGKAVAAVSACEGCAAEVHSLTSEAMTFMKSKLVELRAQDPSGSGFDTVDDVVELEQLLARVELVHQKVVLTRSELETHKVNVLLLGDAKLVASAEEKVRAVELSAQALKIESLQSQPPETIQKAIEATQLLEKDAALCCAEAKKALVVKLRSEIASETPLYKTQLLKLQQKISAALKLLASQRPLLLQGKKLYAAKQDIAKHEVDMTSIEEEIEKLDNLITPLGDEAQSDEAVRANDLAVKNLAVRLQNTLQVLGKALESTAPLFKQSYTKLQIRARSAKPKLDELGVISKQSSEKVECKSMLREAREHVDALDASLQQGLDDGNIGPVDALRAELVSMKAGLDAGAKKVEELQRAAGARKAAASSAAASSDAAAAASQDATPEDAAEQNASKQQMDELLEVAKKHLSFMERMAQPFTAARASTDIVAALEQPLSALKALESQNDELAKACTQIGDASEEGLQLRASGAAILEAAQSSLKSLAVALRRILAMSARALLSTKRRSAQDLFSELTSGSQASPAKDASMDLATFRGFLGNLKDLIFTAEQVEFLFQTLSFAGLLPWWKFSEVVERHYECVKEIGVTTELELEKGTTSRKLEAGELLVEAHDGEKTSNALGAQRVHCKALRDGKLGWVTIAGNQGTIFLKEVSAPCFYTRERTILEDTSCPMNAQRLRDVCTHEVAELLEGPVPTGGRSEQRVHGKKLSDGTLGWISLSDADELPTAERDKSRYACVSGIALTDGLSIQSSAVIRKIERGEMLSALEGPTEDATVGIERLRVKTQKGEEGWISLKGNAGTVFAEEASNLFIISRRVPMHRSQAGGAAEVICWLQEGDRLEGTSEPVTVSLPARQRMKVRLRSDGMEGWVTASASAGSPWKPWCARYKCTRELPLGDTIAATAPVGGAVRESLRPGAMLTLLEGPHLHGNASLVRAKCFVESSKSIGWVTLSNAGSRCVDCLVPS